jgi:protein AATF/BFR2
VWGRKSRLRDSAASTFADLDAKYVGSSKPKSGRVKIFDDDLSDDDEEATGAAGDKSSRGEFDYFGESSGGEESFADEDEDEEEDEDGEEEDEEDEELDDDESPSNTNGNTEDGEETAPVRSQVRPAVVLKRTAMDGSSGGSKAVTARNELDPLAALKSSKSKEVEKGLAIRKQQVGQTRLARAIRVPDEAASKQRIFDELLTARINIQKAWASGSKLPSKKRRIESVCSQC